MTVSTFRPMTPPAALTSSTAIWVAASISWASSAIGPVIGHHDAELDRLLAEGEPVDEGESGDRADRAGSREGLEHRSPRGGTHRGSSALRREM